jgi:hypothetical protein
MPNIGPTQMIIGLVVIVVLIAVVAIGVRIGTRGRK